MRRYIRAPVLALIALVLAAGLTVTGALAENVDPADDGSQFAWSENAGWINAEPANCVDCGVEVTSSDLTGWMWGENIGWISLNCSNTSSCGSVNYGVTNDGSGNLAGYAWAENAGWISFSCDNTSYCATVDYGVTIDGSSGEFKGYAWSENAGWISFSCTNTSTCGTVDYGIETSWTAGPPAKQPHPGDTDGDGCSDQQENGPDETLGGQRDYLSPWDFYDVSGLTVGVPDGQVDLLFDILGVINHFAPIGTEPEYDAHYDRGASAGLNPWNMTAPDGKIDLLIDILGVIEQFGHDCT